MKLASRQNLRPWFNQETQLQNNLILRMKPKKKIKVKKLSSEKIAIKRMEIKFNMKQI
jgi:hypothetical protein